MKTIVIIGAGASGMMAAVTAAASPDLQVLLLERQARAGRKLSATGNGRCNLTNLHAGTDAHYHGGVSGFAGGILRRFPPEAVRQWFRAHGLLTAAEPSGRVYPLSNAANSVTDVLRFALARPNLTLRTGTCVRAVRRDGGGFLVRTDGGDLRADALIVACGGCAGAALGGVSDGYALLESLGHTRTKLCPALVQLKTDPRYPHALRGVRADARLTLTAKRKTLARTEGEVQFTERGVSGPAVFDLSRAASAAGGETLLSIDFLRDYPVQDVLAHLQQRRETAPELPVSELLTGTVHNRVGKMLLRYAGVSGTVLSALTDDDCRAAARACKQFALPVLGTEGFTAAQVTAGGISTAEFDPDTLGSRLVPGLFACGEVLDVDGDCGGYNLQWAWASGHTAGRLGR